MPPISSCAASLFSSQVPCALWAAWRAFAAPVLQATWAGQLPCGVVRYSWARCPVDKESIEITPEMLEAGLREYLRAYREEDSPEYVVKVIYEVMRRAQLQSLSRESS